LSVYENIPARLAEPFPRFKTLVFFALLAFLNLIDHEPDTDSPVVEAIFQGLSIIYVLTLLSSYFVLLPELAKRIRSGEKQLHPSPHAVKTPKVILYTALYPVFLIMSSLLIGVGLVMVSDYIILYFFPYMKEVIASEGGILPVWQAIGMAGISTSEEVWRFSFITLLLIFAKKWFPERWHSVAFQWRALAVGVLVSSACFGLFHIFNYSTGALPTFLATAISGVIFAALTLVTRRIWIAMLVHFGFNFILMSAIELPTGVVLAAYAGMAVLGLVMYKLFRDVKQDLNLSS
jgi:membrane protease YdiL (CAAX protease family)